MKTKLRTVIYIVLFVAATGVALFHVRKLALNQIRAEFSATTQVVAEELNDKIESYVAERMIALRQVGIFFENSEEVTPSEFKNFAEKTIANVPGVQEIEYLDRDYVIRAIYPLEEDQADLSRDLKASPYRALLDKSRDGGMIVLTNPAELAHGGIGLRVYVPIFKGTEFDGFIQGVLRVDDLLAYFITGNIERQFVLNIKDGAGKPIHTAKGLSDAVETSKVTRTVTVGDQRWEIEIWPKGETFYERMKLYNISILIFGVLFAASVGSLMWFLGRQSDVLELEVDKRTRKLEERTRDLDQARQQLTASEERYRGLVHGLDAIVWEADPQTLQLTFVSKQVEMILGYAAADWQARPLFWMECLHPADRERVIESYRTAAREQHDREFEFRMIASDGRTVWLHNSVKAVHEDHETSGLRGFMVNITDRKQAEEELWKERDLMNALMEYTPEYVYFKDAESRFLRDSRAHAKRLGLEHPSQAVGKSDFDFFAREHAEKARADELRIMQTGEPMVGVEERTVLADGRVSWVSTTKVPLRDRSGRIIGTFGITRNITEQKRAQEELKRYAEELERTNHDLQQFAQELQRERELMKAMMEYTPDHVYFKDTESRFLRISRAQSKRFGLTDPSQAIGKTDFDFFGPEHAEEARADEVKIMESGEPIIGIEEREVWPDGQVTWVSTTKVPLRDANGHIVGTFGISRDITEQKRAQEELKRNAEELERSNNELQQFAYVASHDLQEPLRMVASYTQLLARRYKGKLGQEADEFIAYAVDGASRMQTLINDLLAYSRVGTQGRAFAPTPCETVVGQALKNLKFAIEDSEAVVTRDPLPTVMADEGQLVQLFQNLIGNAIKFRKKDAKPMVHVGAERVNGEWVLSVEDNGIGIEQQFFDKVFVIFQRLHGKGEYPGTGIGLAICKKIVERHGGRIWVESEPEKGTKFLFTIPEAGNGY